MLKKEARVKIYGATGTVIDFVPRRGYVDTFDAVVQTDSEISFDGISGSILVMRLNIGNEWALIMTSSELLLYFFVQTSIRGFGIRAVFRSIHIWSMKFLINIRLGLLLILAIFSLDARAQDRFTFHPQQSVYIVAVQGNLGDPSLSALDLAAEKEIRDGFTKRGTFNVAPSLSKADFVFFCVTEYKPNVKAKVLLNVLALALKPDDFQNNRADLIKLRDLALWQSTRSAKVKVKFKSVMEDFHEFALKK